MGCLLPPFLHIMGCWPNPSLTWPMYWAWHWPRSNPVLAILFLFICIYLFVTHTFFLFTIFSSGKEKKMQYIIFFPFKRRKKKMGRLCSNGSMWWAITVIKWSADRNWSFWFPVALSKAAHSQHKHSSVYIFDPWNKDFHKAAYMQTFGRKGH